MINILEMESSRGWGGQEKRTERLVNNIDESRFKVFWAVEFNSSIYKRKNKINADIFPINLSKIYNIFTIIKLCKFVNINNISIISTHSGKDAWIGNIVGFITNTKVVRVRHLALQIKSPYSYNMATKVVTVSNQVKSYLKSKGVKQDKLINIYTGIDTKKFIDKSSYNLRNELNIDKDAKLVGVVAVLRRAKRHQELIDIFLKLNLPNVKMIIVGNGPQMSNLIRIVKETNSNDRVFFLGHRDDVHKLLPNFDIFCLPSEHEALGTSLLEAQSCGIPVLASNVGGIPEAMLNEKTGFLFDNFNQLKLILLDLLHNAERLSFLKSNARNFVVDNFSVEKMVEDTEKLYDNLIGRDL